MTTFRLLMLILCPLVGIFSAIHLLKIKKQILENSRDKRAAKEVFRKMILPFSSKKLRDELYAFSDKTIVGLFFKWMFVYRMLLLLLMIMLLVF